MQKQFARTVRKSDFPAICLMVSQLDHDDTGFVEKEQAIIDRAMEFIDGMPALKLFLSSSPFKDTDHRTIQAYVRKRGLRLGGEFEALINAMHPRNHLFRETMTTVTQEARKLLAAMDRQNSPEELIELSYVVMVHPDDPDQKNFTQSLRQLMLSKVSKYPIEQVLEWAKKSASWLNHDIVQAAAKRPKLGAEDVGKLLHSIKDATDSGRTVAENLNRIAVKALEAPSVTTEALQQIAGAIFDRSENGSGSQALETALIRHLVPRAKTVPEAIETADYFSTKTGRNRFIETFASQHGVKSQAEATDLFLAVRGPDGHLHTSEALQAVVKAAKKSGVKIEAEHLRSFRQQQQAQLFSGQTMELAKLELLKKILGGEVRPERPPDGLIPMAQPTTLAGMQQLLEQAAQAGQLENVRVADPETNEPLTLVEMLAKHGRRMSAETVAIFQHYTSMQIPERYGNA